METEPGHVSGQRAINNAGTAITGVKNIMGSDEESSDWEEIQMGADSAAGPHLAPAKVLGEESKHTPVIKNEPSAIDRVMYLIMIVNSNVSVLDINITQGATSFSS